MTYETLDPIDRCEAERLLGSRRPEDVVTALLRLALHDPDWRWVQDQAMRLAVHPSLEVRRAVGVSLGHLARLHGTIDGARVVPLLRELGQDAALTGVVSDALDDIATFTTERISVA
jgi:hypothetical protein